MNKLTILLFLLTTGVVLCEAQTLPEVSPDSLSKHIYYLASPELKGRNSGSEGQKMAAEYIAGYFQQFGLFPAGNSTKNPFFQEFLIYNNEVFFEFPHRINGKGPWKKFSRNILYYGNKNYQGEHISQKLCTNPSLCCGDTVVYRLLSVSSIQQMKDSVYYLYNNCSNRKFFVQLPDPEFLSVSQAYIDDRCLLYYSGNEYLKLIYGKSDELSSMDNYSLIYNFISKFRNLELIIAAPSFWTEYGYDDITSEINDTVGFKIFKSRVNDTLFTENVVAYLPGSGSGKTIVIGAHYDHLGLSSKGIFYGADDNASGTAGLIEIARLFSNNKRSGKLPHKNILFIAFSAEEMGLLGSEVYVQFPYFSMDSTSYMLNMDMIGRPQSTGSKKSHTLFTSYGHHNTIIRKAVKKSSREMKTIKAYTNPGLINRLSYRYGSDHDRFVRRGIPSGVFFTGLHEDYHKITDTADKINYRNTARVVSLIYLTALKLTMEE